MFHKYLAGLIIFIPFLSLLSGCSALSPSLISQENVLQIDNKNAYVIVGQKLVSDKMIKDNKSNLTHMAMAMHVDGDLIKPMKGIYLPDSTLPASVFQNGPNHEFLVANVDKPTFRTWIIPEKAIGLKSRTIVFANMVASKDGFFIPFHSTLSLKVSNGVAPLEKGKNTRALESFLANAFIVDRPGVYYLGEMNLTGVLEMSGGLSFDKERGGFLSWNADITSNKEQLEQYLNQVKLAGMPVHDLSGSWRELPMDKLTEYKTGEKTLPFLQIK